MRYDERIIVPLNALGILIGKDYVYATVTILKRMQWKYRK